MTTNFAGYTIGSDGRCGPQYSNQACQPNLCCSTSGWCGVTPHCNPSVHGFNGQYDGTNPINAAQAEATLASSSSSSNYWVVSLCILIIIIILIALGIGAYYMNK